MLPRSRQKTAPLCAILLLILAPMAAGADRGLSRRDAIVVHVFVALCDNKHQGIVPVPEKLGDGQDPANNLYWGAQYGVKTFFRKSKQWRVAEFRIATSPAHVLDQAAFTSTFAGRRVYVIAQAYDGANMRETITDFLSTAAGKSSIRCRVRDNGRWMELSGSPDMVCFVGHNGLMDFELKEHPTSTGGPSPSRAVVLACKSREYFGESLRTAGCPPLITTAGLMSPEAYTLDAIIRAWASGQGSTGVQKAAARAYAQYQKCSIIAAERLLVAN